MLPSSPNSLLRLLHLVKQLQLGAHIPLADVVEPVLLLLVVLLGDPGRRLPPVQIQTERFVLAALANLRRRVLAVAVRGSSACRRVVLTGAVMLVGQLVVVAGGGGRGGRGGRVDAERRIRYGKGLEGLTLALKVLDDLGDLGRARVGDCGEGTVVPEERVGTRERTDVVRAVGEDRRRAVLAVEQLVRKLVLLDHAVNLRVQRQPVDQSHVDRPRVNVHVAQHRVVPIVELFPYRIRQLQVVHAAQRTHVRRRRLVKQQNARTIVQRLIRRQLQVLQLPRNTPSNTLVNAPTNRQPVRRLKVDLLPTRTRRRPVRRRRAKVLVQARKEPTLRRAPPRQYPRRLQHPLAQHTRRTLLNPTSLTLLRPAVRVAPVRIRLLLGGGRFDRTALVQRVAGELGKVGAVLFHPRRTAQGDLPREGVGRYRGGAVVFRGAGAGSGPVVGAVFFREFGFAL